MKIVETKIAAIFCCVAAFLQPCMSVKPLKRPSSSPCKFRPNRGAVRGAATGLNDTNPATCLRNGSKNANDTIVFEVHCLDDEESFIFEVKEEQSQSSSSQTGRRGFHGRQKLGNSQSQLAGEVNLITISKIDDSPYIAGSAQIHGKIYHFGTDEDGTLSCTGKKLEAFPFEEHDDMEVEIDEKVFAEIELGALSDVPIHHKLRRPKFHRNLASGAAPFIDVLVPYTKRAYCAIVAAESADSCSVTVARTNVVESVIELAILETNVAFENSGIPGRLRLVHSYLAHDSTFDEQKRSYSQLLTDMRTTTVGALGSIHVKREQYGADIVSMLVDKPESCGLSFTGTPIPASAAFSLVQWSCATGYYSFAHEVAHNLGMRHDRNAQYCNPDGTCCGENGCYNFAWQDPLNRFRSIGAYNCAGASCPRVQYFSQPEKLYPCQLSNGSSKLIRIGSSTNNNARRIRESWDIVANYYGSSSCGNGVCEPGLGENCSSCSQDCIGGYYRGTSKCGNGICEDGENCETCPYDCPGRIYSTREDMRYCCVGGPIEDVNPLIVNYAESCDWNYCQWNVQCDDTPAIKGSFCCGNGVCEPGETVDNCPDCTCIDDGICDNNFETKTCRDCLTSNKCMTSGRVCLDIFPDPCCNGCDGRLCR